MSDMTGYQVHSVKREAGQFSPESQLQLQKKTQQWNGGGQPIAAAYAFQTFVYTSIWRRWSASNNFLHSTGGWGHISHKEHQLIEDGERLNEDMESINNQRSTWSTQWRNSCNKENSSNTKVFL